MSEFAPVLEKSGRLAALITALRTRDSLLTVSPLSPFTELLSTTEPERDVFGVELCFRGSKEKTHERDTVGV